MKISPEIEKRFIPWTDGTNYIDYMDLVLLASIESPREITDPADLHDLNLLASQELISFGTTMYRGIQNEIFTIPTSKLTEYGQVVLKYMRSKMDDLSLVALQNDANNKIESTNKWLRKNLQL
jgi:hypothetical protein